MKIETQFKIDDLLSRKHDVMPDGDFMVLEVMEIITQTCYTGIQIFYYCKVIIANKVYEAPYDKSGKFTWKIGHRYGSGDNSNCWKKYTENELIFCPGEYKKIVLGK